MAAFGHPTQAWLDCPTDVAAEGRKEEKQTPWGPPGERYFGGLPDNHGRRAGETEGEIG